ncbi:FimV/HubP family polar landmark protein [Acidovorax sp. SUPP3334]|uniref:FimV/HubP family polar landmark protein n=1 Tax=Acidovorax sp. SUPP3334 TaxID=2920881 RepID=UPI0023DE3DC7|nr:FimV/HubP family polar landmark protein [Acidovorax sp. SUPP3334]GKT25324.1 membrane protein [Acidovorax sp. SUPP3334]
MHRWKLSILAAAAVMSAGLYATDANALALGRLTVQSALGEPLRAEIELPQITAAEADSLRAAPASPQVFRAQGMEISPALNTLRVQLQRRSDGSMVLQLTSDRPVNDPFVDLVLDATWSSGQIVRSYTMLFDPPALRRTPATVTASPQVTAPAPTAAAPSARTPRNTDSAAPQAAAPATSPRPAAAPRPAPAPAAAPAAPAASGGTVTVQAGDTAGRLAAANRPAGVSLDQMLVAMMRSNPDAFIRGNVNRLKSGAVLQLPDETQARATPPGEARQIIAAQSRDFNDFRRRLAGAAPTAEVAAAERSASGKVQAQVEDKKPATAAPDKLTLSKGAMQGQKAAEDQVAKDKQASAASARMAELSKNISDLNKLGTASAPVAAGTGAPAATASTATGAAVATGAVVPTAAPPAPQAAASVASPASAPAAPVTPVAVTPASGASSAASASAAAASASVVASAPQPAPAAVPAPAPAAEEPSFISGLFDDPLLPLAGGALLALLLGYGVYRTVQNRRNHQGVDSSFMESKLQPDSFFGASGGQRVDTASSQLSTGSSMAYSPSQLDAGGDVDPVAEADVYLAYGRDLQAEEILKEAVRHNPDRTSVHVKLGEIYAKRQDRKALEAVAQDVFKLTDGQGPDWARVSELGRELDPENPLYQPGGRPGLAGLDDDGPNAGNDFASTFTGGRPQTASATSAALPPDMDLDLDLDLPGDALTEAPPAPPAAPGAFAAAAAAAGVMAAAPAMAREPAPAPAVSEPPALDMGALDLPDPSWDKPVTTAAAPLSPTPASADLEFPDDLRLMDSAPSPLSPSTDAAPSGPAPLEFDLGALSLDLDSPGASGQTANPSAQELPQATPALPDDPLATKLALAEEFNAIGDSEGARTLIEEVIAESSGALKTRAQRLLSELG